MIGLSPKTMMLLLILGAGLRPAIAAELAMTECPHGHPDSPNDPLRMAYVHEFATYTAIKPEIVFNDALGNLHQITDAYAYSRDDYRQAKIFCVYESDSRLVLPVEGRLTQCGRVSKPVGSDPQQPGRITGTIAFWCSGLIGK